MQQTAIVPTSPVMSGCADPADTRNSFPKLVGGHFMAADFLFLAVTSDAIGIRCARKPEQDPHVRSSRPDMWILLYFKGLETDSRLWSDRPEPIGL